jgi:hypothetical protein
MSSQPQSSPVISYPLRGPSSNRSIPSGYGLVPFSLPTKRAQSTWKRLPTLAVPGSNYLFARAMGGAASSCIPPSSARNKGGRPCFHHSGKVTLALCTNTTTPSTDVHCFVIPVGRLPHSCWWKTAYAAVSWLVGADQVGQRSAPDLRSAISSNDCWGSSVQSYLCDPISQAADVRVVHECAARRSGVGVAEPAGAHVEIVPPPSR